MNKEELIELLGEEKANELVTEFDNKNKEIETLKTQVAKIEEDNKTVLADKELEFQDKLSKKDVELEELKEKLGASGDNIKALQSEMADYKVQSALDLALTKKGCKNIKATKSLIDMESIKLNDNGEVIGVDSEISRLIADENSSFMFDKDIKGNANPEPTPKKPTNPTEPNMDMSWEEITKFFENKK